MIKSLLIVLALCASAQAGPPQVYDAHATVIDWTDLPTCGAAERMLQDRHRITLTDGAVLIDGFRWNPLYRDGVSADVSFHDGHERLVYLTMELQFDDRGLIGTYTLYGVLDRTKDGWHPCVDRVEIRGIRI